jgi:hypothetical protein
MRPLEDDGLDDLRLELHLAHVARLWAFLALLARPLPGFTCCAAARRRVREARAITERELVKELRYAPQAQTGAKGRT